LRHIDVLDSVDSTQDEVVRRLKRGKVVGAVLAHKQFAGRGRHGRVWTTFPGESLAMSFAWTEGIDAVWPPGLALSAGLVAAETFDTQIAWPNDLMLGGKKIGGLLSEIVPCSLGKVPVVGLGVNLTLTRSPEGMPWAASLLMAGRTTPAPLDAAIAFLARIDEHVPPRSFQEILERWFARDATAGKTYALPDGRLARAIKVMRDGSLQTQIEGNEVIVPSATLIYGSGS